MATEAKVRKVCEFLCQHPSHRRQHPKLCVSVRRRAKHSARPGVEGRINFKAGSSVGGGGLPVVTYTGGSVRGGTSCGATPSGVDKSVMYGGGTFFLSPIFYTFLFFFSLAIQNQHATCRSAKNRFANLIIRNGAERNLIFHILSHWRWFGLVQFYPSMEAHRAKLVIVG